ncbi:hypothetical protein SAMN05421640_1035 [Ekhidna lutea]|uniref:Nucleotidyltransferase substrate binding protein, HI0074 family n=1 Tax=Ekhidna lutea TaxID=447679 RepID=A0A239GXW6_EKHLU|nr:hypothetical protein [Ekhidna lutea]SNS73373.1 hypothetical protein SAMN05421640_1035 [Ekhidna lutea]
MGNNKETIYSKFIGKLENTIKEEYYFEAAWVEYVILEDRLVSLLESTGGAGSVRMMGPKIGEIKSRMSSYAFLKGNMEADDLIPRLENWKDSRNILMHSMANGQMTMTDIEHDIVILAIDGEKLVRDFASAARRVKDRAKKEGLI